MALSKERAEEIIKRCNKQNELKAPFGRSIHLIDDEYVCKITNGIVDEDEYHYVPKDSYPNIEDVHVRDLNEVTVLNQLKEFDLVPKVYYHEKGIIIQEYIKGDNLEDSWFDLTIEQKEQIKQQVIQFMQKLIKLKINTIPIKLDERYDGAFEGKTMFLHSDLNLSNIIIDSDNKRVVGIVDWEYSGNFNKEVISNINKDMCFRGRSLGLEIWKNLYDLF